jgi:anthranilate/para-aminobenzoate synthase component I
MIVDLVRNDLGKLAEPGGVDVPVLMDIEPYRGIWHGVSTVRARLKPEYTAGDALEALFPGGSIIGAPKRRAMEILQQIENTPRGFYTGSLGFIAPNGDAHFSILIRTLIHDSAGWHLGVGGGIVADSKAQRELIEMNEKVAVFRELLAVKAA